MALSSTPARAALAKVVTEAQLWGQALLASYAQILFSPSRWVGAVLVAATAVAGTPALWGLGAAGLAVAIARMFRFNLELTRAGLYSYCALLIGLGGGVLFEPTADAFALVAVSAVASVFVTAAVHSALGVGFNLPALTFPFLLVFYMAIGAARVVDVPLVWLRAGDEGLAAYLVDLPHWAQVYLQSLGALFFLPRADVGLGVLVALAVHSRIALLLSGLGFGIAAAVVGRLILVADGTLPFVLGYNFILTAIALGGIWFVPSLSALLVAAGGVLICSLVSVGLVPFMTIQELPLLILPFNLTIVVLLYAMRQRMVDRRPKAVAVLLGNPEQHLAWYRTRVERFGASYGIRLHAPFSGAWTCTQSTQGPLTHRGAWAHAFDFEVFGADKRQFDGDGGRVSDYRCWRLPVLACADGTVVDIVDVVEDNPVGVANLHENWGNLVLLYHAPGLYSLVAHLARGSVKVRPGQLVRAGDVLGACGSSGRSPIPHLHFQLQGLGIVGAATIPTELHDVVQIGVVQIGVVQIGPPDGGGEVSERLHATLVPAEGAVVRNVEVEAELVRLLDFANTGLTLELDGVREPIAAEVDLYGNQVLRSLARDSHAIYRGAAPTFTIFDTHGDRRSVLWLIHVALARVPYEGRPGLRWDDRLQPRGFLGPVARVLYDFASPFVPGMAVVMDYRFERDGAARVIRGESRPSRLGPRVRSEARLEPGRGLVRVEVQIGARTRVATAPVDPPSASLERANPGAPP